MKAHLKKWWATWLPKPSGCTFSATNTGQACAHSYPPPGWSLDDAEGFESGSTHTGEGIGYGSIIGPFGHNSTHSLTQL
jgi:hypothetical protein